MLLTDDKFFNDPEFREMLKAYEEDRKSVV